MLSATATYQNNYGCERPKIGLFEIEHLVSQRVNTLFIKGRFRSCSIKIQNRLIPLTPETNQPHFHATQLPHRCHPQHPQRQVLFAY